MTIVLLVRKRGNSRAIARSLMKSCPNSATESSTAVVKKEDKLDVSEATELSHLSCEVVAF